MVETVKLRVDQLKFEIGKCPFLLTDSITPARDFFKFVFFLPKAIEKRILTGHL